jgi:16S rRNA (guanine1516-N2)-methyltransferase
MHAFLADPLFMTADLSVPTICVQPLTPLWLSQANTLGQQLSLPVMLEPETEFVLQIGDLGVQLVQLGPDSPGPVRVDLLEGSAAHRRRFGGGSGQMIAKAVGVQGGIRPSVLDATAGLGRDGFVLATVGCSVTLIERQPLIAALLADGLYRATQDEEVGPIVARMTLLKGNAIELMQTMTEAPQVVYLDPMFPHRDKSALVKKEMRIFRPLVGDDLDAPALLDAALQLASHRVVVKRPRKAPCIDGVKPGYSLEGKSSRYDIYPKKALNKS